MSDHFETESLPDLLAMPDGSPISTPGDWRERRRPNLQDLIQTEEYGYLPPLPKDFAATTVTSDGRALGGLATIRQIDIRTTDPAAAIGLLLVTPNQAASPVPCFLGMNFRGDHRLLASPEILPPDGMRFRPSQEIDAERGASTGEWAIEESIRRGYAVASFFYGDTVPDHGDSAKKRLRDFAAGDVPDDVAPGALACWAWSISRVVDYLAADSAIDPDRIAVVGHSRNGKAALLAAAMDERIALVIPSQSGTGGAAPSRDIGEAWSQRETVQRITDAFPHWFGAQFKTYGADPNRLPFDQHALIALCAPRPVLLSCAAEDLWANPAGQFAMLKAARPVYALLCGNDDSPPRLPDPNQLAASRLGYHLRPGKHSMTGEDWAVWLDYADVWL